MLFQERLRMYREQAGYKSAKEFAEKLGIPYPSYMAYENKKREPKYEVLKKIASFLHVTIDDLLDYHLPEERKDDWENFIQMAKTIGIFVRKIKIKKPSSYHALVGLVFPGEYYIVAGSGFSSSIPSPVDSKNLDGDWKFIKTNTGPYLIPVKEKEKLAHIICSKMKNWENSAEYEDFKTRIITLELEIFRYEYLEKNRKERNKYYQGIKQHQKM